MVSNVFFRVDLKLLMELGERLISRDEVAVVELVKNSYDADAKKVEVHIKQNRIEIKDHGKGMNRSEIEEGWLTIGTRIKKRQKRTELGRRILGEKGIGRLAVLRLGRLISIHTQKKQGSCYKLTVNWENTRKKLETTNYTPLSELSMNLEETSEYIFPNGEGTSIMIESLNAIWDENKIDRLKNFLSRLVEPQTDGKKAFTIEFHAGGKVVEIESPEITRKPHYSLDISIDENGAFSGEIKVRNQKEPHIIENQVLRIITTQEGRKIKWKSKNNGGCGSFRFNLNAWDLDAKGLSGYKNILRQWSGISLHRDGFRVVQPDIDWLGLDLRRVQNPTLRLSTNQLIGSVYITADENPNLIDKTDREGIIESEPLAILKGAIYFLMNILERKRYDSRRKKPLSPSSFANYLDTTPLKNVAKTLPSEKKKEIKKYASKLDKFRGLLGEWTLGRDRMATIGILGAKLIHSARSALMKINDNYPLIEKYHDQFTQPLQNRLKRMVKGGRMLDKIFKELDPFLKFREKRYKDVVLKDLIDSLDFIFKPELDKNSIRIRNTIDEKIVFRANPTDIYVIFSNFLDNSIYWLKNFDTKEKVIEFREIQENAELKIEIADSGPGIDPEYIHHIFDAGFTTKPNGTGLGLSIVNDAVEMYGGTVNAGRDDFLNGALFTIVFPLKR